MKTMLYLVVLLVIMGSLVCPVSQAQGRRKAMKANNGRGPDPAMVRLVHGDTLLVLCDSAFVFNRDAEVVRRLQIQLDDSEITQLRSRVALGDSIKSLKDSVTSLFREINAVQNQSYDTLRARFSLADSLVRLSTANTDAALSYIKRVKVTSFLASGLAGGVVGGFGIRRAGQEGFNWWPGFVVGAVVGVGVNWMVMTLFQ